MEPPLLTKDQEKALRLVFTEPRLEAFYLSGGTALSAFYLKHRVSDDLDFFTKGEKDTLFLHEFVDRLKEELGAGSVAYDRLYDRSLFRFSFPDREELKLEFTKYPFTELQQPERFDGYRVDSERDIAANKIMALLDRFDPKDFVDLYFLLSKRTLSDIWKDAERKFAYEIDPVFLGGELLKVNRIAGMPKMVKPLTIEELKSFFSEKAKTLAPSIFI